MTSPSTMRASAGENTGRQFILTTTSLRLSRSRKSQFKKTEGLFHIFAVVLALRRSIKVDAVESRRDRSNPIFRFLSTAGSKPGPERRCLPGKLSFHRQKLRRHGFAALLPRASAAEESFSGHM